MERSNMITLLHYYSLYLYVHVWFVFTFIHPFNFFSTVNVNNTKQMFERIYLWTKSASVHLINSVSIVLW